MEKSIKPFFNWRTHVLAIIAAIALILLIGETYSIVTMLFTKAAAAILAILCYALARYWDSKGKISELKELINEDE